MPNLVIISATPGPTTTERLLELIANHPGGIGIKELHRTLNRPISMIHICLKDAISSGLVVARKEVPANAPTEVLQVVYYPTPSLPI